MPKPLRFYVYDARGVLRASFRFAPDAAFFVGWLGTDATVRKTFGRRGALWVEGFEKFSAAVERYRAAEIILYRLGGVHGPRKRQKKASKYAKKAPELLGHAVPSDQIVSRKRPVWL